MVHHRSIVAQTMRFHITVGLCKAKEACTMTLLLYRSTSSNLRCQHLHFHYIRLIGEVFIDVCIQRGSDFALNMRLPSFIRQEKIHDAKQTGSREFERIPDAGLLFFVNKGEGVLRMQVISQQCIVD